MTKAATPKKETIPKKDTAKEKKTPSSASKKPDHAKRLEDLHDVGQKTMKDFELLGIKTLDDLKGKTGMELYEALQEKRPAVSIRSLYTFEACVAQVEDPNLPAEQKKWKYYSEKRKKEGTTPTKTKTTRSSTKKKAAEAEESEEVA